MTDEELRALVRTAIQRHLPQAQVGGQVMNRAHDSRREPRVDDSRVDPPWRAHPSFGKLLVSPGDDDGGPCMIEPSVQCNHCGFCQSYGH